ncbi:hypothetical protein ACFL1N_00890 [Thermodesulfobacteriota bacterium]
MESNRDNTMTITGIIYPSKRDNKGKIIEVLIDSLDDDQETYLVFPGKRSVGLFESLNKKVEVCGNLREDEKGNLILNVKTFKNLEDT